MSESHKVVPRYAPLTYSAGNFAIGLMTQAFAAFVLYFYNDLLFVLVVLIWTALYPEMFPAPGERTSVATLRQFFGFSGTIGGRVRTSRHRPASLGPPRHPLPDGILSHAPSPRCDPSLPHLSLGPASSGSRCSFPNVTFETETKLFAVLGFYFPNVREDGVQ
ncbi:MAG: hypothetical protein KM296_07170 [Brockia lithotrophica]|nr:hypothetical protein [Brockia lithotrophica]